MDWGNSGGFLMGTTVEGNVIQWAGGMAFTWDGRDWDSPNSLLWMLNINGELLLVELTGADTCDRLEGGVTGSATNFRFCCLPMP